VITSPIVIAHRGASGYLPEHTLAGKALAYGLGADFLEQDVLVTRDGELVVLHDLYLDEVTDVAHRFPTRCRDDGRFYVIDFDLAELKTLTVRERRSTTNPKEAKYPGRFAADAALFPIVSLDEELSFVKGLNRSMGRDVGIYPEIKDPAWHREHGFDLSALLLRKLRAFGYAGRRDDVFVQCFDALELERVRHELGCELRLIQLVDTEPSSASLLEPEGLERVASYANGIGPGFRQLVRDRGESYVATETTARAHDLGLEVHPYTFRRDELPGNVQSLEELLAFFFSDVRVDGAFCDHPDVGVRVRNALAVDRSKETS
jgi:glycerophosphoryl diester phosphodiesterase